MKFVVEEDMFAERGKPIIPVANMYDHTVIKGLSDVRRENGSESDYYIMNDIDSFGIVSYIPKYLADSKNFIDPAVNKEIHSEAHKVVFRVYVIFQTGYKIYLKD